ncbi:MAG: hypothetical protein NC483_00475 [Ruminococcus sp.]|nr:hypothetical protein [Ruminococcus sp.]
MQAILVALISGGLSLIGVVFSNISSNKRIEHQLEMQQAVFDTKLEELTREVREHNNFAHRVPVVEEHIKRIDARLEKLERKHE